MAKLIMTSAEAREDRGKWLALRRGGIGGSDVAAIMGASRWKSAFALWQEKTGQTEPEDLSGNERVHFGIVLEDVVAREFSERTGLKVRRRGMLADDEYPFMLANVDRVIEGEDAGLECKTANGFAAKEWEGDEVPDAYYLQCQWYMMITGFPKWYIAALIGGNHFVWKEIARCDEDIKAMREAAIGFWGKVQRGEMPEADGSKSCADALLKKYPGGRKDDVQLGGDALPLVEEYLKAKELIDALEAQRDAAANKLKGMLGDNEIGWAGESKVSWAVRKGSETLDKKRLKAEMPDVYGKYAKAGSPTRIFKIS